MITGTISSRYGIRVLAWDPQPGKPLPLPRLEDDRALFPVETVKHVLAWLNRERARFDQDRTPTPITISMGQTIGREGATRNRLQVRYGRLGDPLEKISTANFLASTVEIVLRNKKGAPLTATFTYLAARDEQGRAIVGPYLRHAQQRTLVCA